MLILIKTELGEITAELYAQQAPVTVANFLRYISEKTYDNSTFYRMVSPQNRADNFIPTTIDISVIQGGIGMEGHPKKHAPIALETTQQTGLKHLDGTLSMSRFEPGTSNSEFFICVDDQPELDFGGKRNPDGQGFAAFGRVVKRMDVIRKIHACPAKGQWLEPPIRILSIRVYTLMDLTPE
jgi:peptidyl-prolyl cis-trans isomerase A (cyclophilin A)